MLSICIMHVITCVCSCLLEYYISTLWQSLMETCIDTRAQLWLLQVDLECHVVCCDSDPPEYSGTAITTDVPCLQNCQLC